MSQLPVGDGSRQTVKSLAIAQPTFLPWLGWYDLVDQVDFLILLDDVAFSRQSWQQRNRIRTKEGLSYLTVPVHTAGKLGQRISDTKIVNNAFVQKMVRTVAQNYRRAEYFDRYFPEFCAVLEKSIASGSLCDLNCGLIEWLAAQLGVATPSVRSSQLGVGGKRGAHVALLCEHFDAQTYVSPPGAEDYLVEDRVEFDRRSIRVEIHVYEHPVYRQCFKPFEPYASALDLLLNEGSRAGTIMRSGRKPTRPLRAKDPSEYEDSKPSRVYGRRLKMNVAFRVDASSEIGTGHFIRCLTLADALKQCGWRIRFVSRRLSDQFKRMLSDREYDFSHIAHAEPGKIDQDLSHAHWLGTSQTQDAMDTIEALSDSTWEWLIIDHYALDERWETMLRKSVGRIAVIDDLADRRHDCDVLLDQNLHADAARRYIGKLPGACRLLLGPQYALLRQEFRVARQSLKPRDGTVNRILICFGGVDVENYTSQAIEAIAGLRVSGLRADVVVGSGNQHGDQIGSQCVRHGFSFHVQTSRVAELMAAADLAIGAGGMVIWERCCLGLPALAICVAENQKEQIVAAACDGLLYAPEPKNEFVSFIQHHAEVLMQNRFLRKAISGAGMRAVDGDGVWRVVRSLTRSDIQMRVATTADANSLFLWRNDPAVRAASRIPNVIDLNTHQTWVASVVNSDDRILLIGECEGAPVGVVRFDLQGTEAEISIYLVPGVHPPGQGRSLLQCGERWLAANRPAVARIRARVLAGNRRSERLFLGAGYEIDFTDFSKRIGR
jgi:UDP-2,4-diacetamido-2,4,6-trideoxy-beta-L-altropyranose hydrolase